MVWNRFKGHFVEKNLFENLLHEFYPYLRCVKSGCYFVALLFAVLTCFPCSDGDLCAHDAPDDHAVTISEHHTDAGAADICSPLCACSCCSTHVQLPVAFSFESHTPLLMAHQSSLNLPFVQAIDYAIWQPPRVA